MEESGIQFAHITSRTKTLESFLEKITRKAYANPINEIKDFAEVRLVFLYHSDREGIERVIEDEFIVKEKILPASTQDINYFGYEALHYVVTLGDNCRGARYDTLRKLPLEIQVRTVLQDAWALIAHHLIYKRESDVPDRLQRRLNRLVGLFETADEQFTEIRSERERYIEATRDRIRNEDELDIELNLDSIIAYCERKFPNMDIHFGDLSVLLASEAIKKFKSSTKRLMPPRMPSPNIG
jgi:putative GTP pyrophosphokinase